MKAIRGKSVKATTWDIAEGYVTVNPLFLKPLEVDTIIELYHAVHRMLTEIRSEKFPFNDIRAIRSRNTKLQRLNTTQMLIKNFLRERRLFF